MANIEKINNIFASSVETKKNFFENGKNAEIINEAANLIIEAYKAGGKLIVFGNGGSAADSQHMAAEMMVRFKKERKSLPCIALTTNTSNITACGNDYSFDDIFSRQVEGLADNKDVIIAISTSGNSPNVIKAVKIAKDRDAKVIVMTGKDGGKLKGLGDVSMLVEDDNTARIQEVHILIIHILCELIDDAF